MKNFRVTRAKWANWRDMDLPFYRKWNRDNPLPGNFWQKIWEYPFVALEIPSKAPCLEIGGTHPFVLSKNFPKAVSVDIHDFIEPGHPFHQNQSQPGKMLIQDAHRLPLPDDAYDFSFSLSALDKMSSFIDGLKEILRVTRHKVVITLNVSDTWGLSARQIVELVTFLDFDLPPMPGDCIVSDDLRLWKWGIKPTRKYNHIRTLGLVIESNDTPTDCGIIIPHWESYPFVTAAIRHIRTQKNDDIHQHLYIVDDDSKDGSFERLWSEYGDDEDITLWQVKREDVNIANVGYLLDCALEKVKEKYVCMLDADAFPISADWLSFPIWLLERYGCSAVGCDTGLSNAYLPNRLYPWQNNHGYQCTFGLYDNENFICVNNFYRIMKTSTARVVSEKVGFARREKSSRGWIGLIYRLFRKLRRIRRRALPFFNRAMDLRRIFQDADNGVIANCFMDLNRLGPKFNLPILTWVGFTPKDGVFGQNVCGLLFHFALSTRALSRWRREVNETGAEFLRFAEIIQREGFSDELLTEMLGKQKLQAGGYQGQIPVEWYEEARFAMQKELEIYQNSRKTACIHL